MNRLLVSLTKALDTDEKLWISVITSSINQTCDILRSRTLSVPNPEVQLPTENILCQIIKHLTERISAFMRREDEVFLFLPLLFFFFIFKWCFFPA